MTPKRAILAATLVLATIAGACTTPASVVSPPPAEPQPLVVEPTPGVPVAADAPNIIVFMTDDQRIDEMRALPQTQERIFDAGVTFTNSIVNLPACCPSRATFLTGQNAVNHGVLTNSGVSGGFANFTGQQATLATALDDAGYYTIFVGKYLNGFGFTEDLRVTPPGWNDFRGLISPTEVYYESPSLWVNDVLFNYGEQDYVTDVLTQHASDAIARVGADAPIFAWISYPAPHSQAGGPLIGFDVRESIRAAKDPSDAVFLAPPIPAERHIGAFDGVSLSDAPSVNEADISDKPKPFQRRLRSPDELEAPRLLYQRALESLLSVDDSIEELIGQIEITNDRETWLIFTSDNGLLIGEQRQFGVKYWPYDLSVRVPLGITGPGVEPSAEISMPVSNIDLAPTIIDLAGAEPPREADGISLVPYLVGERDQHGRALLIQGFDLRAGSPPYSAVHTGDSLYVEWANGERELYNMNDDPFQLSNIIDGPFSAPLLDRNKALLRALEDCVGVQCREIGRELDVPTLGR